jgi:hypothetical protein
MLMPDSALIRPIDPSAAHPLPAKYQISPPSTETRLDVEDYGDVGVVAETDTEPP